MMMLLSMIRLATALFLANLFALGSSIPVAENSHIERQLQNPQLWVSNQEKYVTFLLTNLSSLDPVLGHCPASHSHAPYYHLDRG